MQPPPIFIEPQVVQPYTRPNIDDMGISIRCKVLLIHFLNYIPEYFSLRLEYIVKILNFLEPSLQLEVSKLEFTIAMSEIKEAALDDVLGSPPLDLLWRASLHYGIPLTIFLSPPVSSCNKCHCWLSTHNKPTTVLLVDPL